MMKYKFIEDLVSDVMFEAYGKDLPELFANAAMALFSVICQIDKVSQKEVREIEVSAENLEDLMFNWIQELIITVDTEGLFFSRFEITEIDEKHLKARCYGQEASPEFGETVVKAITYYKYKLERTKEGYKVRITLDI
jgi:SHS2 domain-containing protein